MEEFLDEFGYLALMIGTFLEGETAILVAASLIYKGFFEIPYTVLFGFAGSFVSDWLYFAIGKANGRYFISKRPSLQRKIRPVSNFFERHRLQVLLTYRFLYGFRVVIPLIIGMSKIPPRQFLLFSVISGILWAVMVSGLGYGIGRFLELETGFFQKNLLVILGCFAIFGFLIGYTVKKITFRKIIQEQD